MKFAALSLFAVSMVPTVSATSTHACDAPVRVQHNVSYPATRVTRTISRPVVTRTVTRTASVPVKEVIYVVQSAPTPSKAKTQLASVVTKADSNTIQETRIAIRCNSTYRLPAKFLGNESGEVALNINGLPIPCQIVDWKQDAVVFRSPNLNLTNASNARLDIFRADGRVIKTAEIELLPEGLEEIRLVEEGSELAFLLNDRN